MVGTFAHCGCAGTAEAPTSRKAAEKDRVTFCPRTPCSHNSRYPALVPVGVTLLFHNLMESVDKFLVPPLPQTVRLLPKSGGVQVLLQQPVIPAQKTVSIMKASVSLLCIRHFFRSQLQNLQYGKVFWTGNRKSLCPFWHPAIFQALEHKAVTRQSFH